MPFNQRQVDSAQTEDNLLIMSSQNSHFSKKKKRSFKLLHCLWKHQREPMKKRQLFTLTSYERKTLSVRSSNNCPVMIVPQFKCTNFIYSALHIRFLTFFNCSSTRVISISCDHRICLSICVTICFFTQELIVESEHTPSSTQLMKSIQTQDDVSKYLKIKEFPTCLTLFILAIC